MGGGEGLAEKRQIGGADIKTIRKRFRRLDKKIRNVTSEDSGDNRGLINSVNDMTLDLLFCDQ